MKAIFLLLRRNHHGKERHGGQAGVMLAMQVFEKPGIVIHKSRIEGAFDGDPMTVLFYEIRISIYLRPPESVVWRRRKLK